MEHQERRKAVARIEEELERMISRGELPRSGGLPSERSLARSYDVARGTIREALQRLAARGLVVQRQGRQARGVAIEHAVTLENLGVILQSLGSTRSRQWRLLEGYLELKRETTIDLLVRGGERATETELVILSDACFALREAARWDDGSRDWVEQEFELLRKAAQVADRPGHFLLIQSLQRAFHGMSDLLRPRLATEAVRHWSEQAMHWLRMREVEALRGALRPLLLACDEHVLEGLGRRMDPDEPH